MNNGFVKYLSLSFFLHFLLLGSISVLSMTEAGKPAFSKSYNVKLASSSKAGKEKGAGEITGKKKQSSRAPATPKQKKSETPQKKTKSNTQKNEVTSALKETKKKSTDQPDTEKKNAESMKEDESGQTAPEKGDQKGSKKGLSEDGSAEADKGSGGSSITGLDVNNFKYSWYLDTIRRKVAGGWIKPSAEASDVIIYFKVDSDGKLVDMKVEHSSGNEIVDRSCLRAVKSAEPLPALPRGFEKNKLGVHFKFLL